MYLNVYIFEQYLYLIKIQSNYIFENKIMDIFRQCNLNLDFKYKL